MSNRLKTPLLETIGRDMAPQVTGLEHYDPNTPNLLVANHACLRDIFAIPAALPDACKVVISSRLAYKNSTTETALRRLMIENSLNTIPLEVHGSREKLRLGIEMASRALQDGWSLLIFPEGAYTGEAQVTRGRTGASRILFDAKMGGTDVNLLPVGVHYSPWPRELDNYMPQDEEITVAINEPIRCDDAFSTFTTSSDPELRRQALRQPIDIAMRAIAQSINLPYIDKAIQLRPRTTIILESGEEVPND